jgi:hypothetical protein
LSLDSNIKAEFTVEDKKKLEQLLASAEFVEKNAQNILLRTNVSSAPGNIDTFVITTSGKPEDTIEYTSSTDKVILDKLAGGGIISDAKDNDYIDGGTF